MSDQQPLPSPWALWTVFDDIPRWFLARGYPPTLRDPRRWVRAMRVTVLVLILTTCASWGFALLADMPFFWGRMWWFTVTPFGGLVLFPLSRWMGHPLWLATLTIPLVILSYPLMFWAFNDVFGVSVRGYKLEFRAFWAFLIAVGTLWPRTAWAWLIVELCVVSAALEPLLDRQAFTILERNRQILPGTLGHFMLMSVQENIKFLSVTIPLGIWLWDPPRE